MTDDRYDAPSTKCECGHDLFTEVTELVNRLETRAFWPNVSCFSTEFITDITQSYVCPKCKRPISDDMAQILGCQVDDPNAPIIVTG